ncbi:glycosyltransferase family 4 protein [Brevundimonas sp. SL130]|uniref:glycosyltransferase family 4 protein n=1 Tax=Brevundimonas sp. SL130 TaxID=2995143 RepID=UPI00226CA0B0|nr:glycosyltransferase family 1 protein [Brevundimonas sp. SL130]WAC59878.1 glycosyltransferase family 1 protein [Brevundimonas sp. SL130]
MSNHTTVVSDMRWPAATGIGLVMDAVVSRKPNNVDIYALDIQGSIGSPLSPIRLSVAAAKQNTGDVFWSAGFVPPAWCNIPSVVTVHDLTHLHYYGPAKKLYYQTVFRPLYKRMKAVICVSEFTRCEFLEWSGMDPSLVHTVHNGSDPAFAANRRALDLGYPFVLYPGNHRSYKNLQRLIRAYAISALPNMGVHLAMTGRPNPEVDALALELGVADKVHALGFIEQADVPALYRAAEAIAYVSLYEGFGLPIIEGMASETPVLTSNVSAMPEVAGEAAVLVDPLNVEAIAHGLDRIVTDTELRGRLSVAGLKRLEDFDWNRSAADVWNIVSGVKS